MIRAVISKIEMKKSIAKINETKSCFSVKANKIDKSLIRLIIKKWGGGRGLKSVKLEMEKEKLQLTSQKYKRS